MSRVVRIEVKDSSKAIILEYLSREISADEAREYIDNLHLNHPANVFFGIGDVIPLDYSESSIYFDEKGYIITILPTLNYLPSDSKMNLIINPEKEWLDVDSIPLYYLSGERVKGKDEDIK